ncbi:hypothetical protein EV424DRAFT_1350226 [Suillus variegatus]|nr:hypothetical protein EV424DRAFT_1350226 [Suillus variegatus]
MYEAKLGLDDNNDSEPEAEAAKAKKHKGKSKKSSDKRRKKGPIAEEPTDITTTGDILALETQATNVCLIQLVIDTDGRIVRSLQDSENFIKNLLQDDTPRCHTNETWPHYESAQETEDLEHETVEERHNARVHDKLSQITNCRVRTWIDLTATAKTMAIKVLRIVSASTDKQKLHTPLGAMMAVTDRRFDTEVSF